MIAATGWPWMDRVVAATALQLLVPFLTVSYRLLRQGHARSIAPGLFLYWLYYWARIEALFLIVLRRAGRYRK